MIETANYFEQNAKIQGKGSIRKILKFPINSIQWTKCTNSKNCNFDCNNEGRLHNYKKYCFVPRLKLSPKIINYLILYQDSEPVIRKEMSDIF